MTQTGVSQYAKSKQLKQTLDQLIDNYRTNPEEIAELLAFKSNFYQYSFNNTILIYSQNPHCTFVDSFEGWKKRGYRIKAGQHGMKVLYPIRTELFEVSNTSSKKIFRRVLDATPEEKEQIKNGQIKTFTTTRFGVGHVFDIAQTDCPPEDYPKYYKMGYSSDKHAQLYDSLKLFCQSKGFPVFEKDLHSISLRGLFYPGTKEIHISDKLDDTEKLSTLAHEFGHALMHSDFSNKKQKYIKELEADCISIMLQQEFGIPLTDNRKKHFVDHYNVCKDLEDFKLEDVLKNSSEVFMGMRDEFQQYIDSNNLLELNNKKSKPKTIDSSPNNEDEFHGKILYLDPKGKIQETELYTDELEYKKMVQENSYIGKPTIFSKISKSEYQDEAREQIEDLLNDHLIGTELQQRYNTWSTELKNNLEFVNLQADILNNSFLIKEYTQNLKKDETKYNNLLSSAIQRQQDYTNQSDAFLTKYNTEFADYQKSKEPPFAEPLKTKTSKPKNNENYGQQNADIINYIKNNVSILKVAEDMGFTPVQEGGYYTLKEHDSVRFFMDTNSFNRFSVGIGGSTIDFVMHFGGMNNKEAIQSLKEQYVGDRFDALPQKPLTQPVPQKKEPIPFVLPEKVEENLKEKDHQFKRAFAYLTKTRCLDEGIVNDCIKNGLIYEDKKHNVVFVGYDSDKKAAYATRHTTLTYSDYKGDVAGSRQDIGFMVDNKSERLYVTEAPIDALSIMCLLKKTGKPVNQSSYMATCGTCKDAALYYRLDHNNIKEVILANDNDEFGQKANRKIFDHLKSNYPNIKISRLKLNEKDVNEHLCKYCAEKFRPKKIKSVGKEVER